MIMKTFRERRGFTKIIAIFVLQTFLLSSVAIAVPQAASPAKGDQAAFAAGEVISSPEKIVIPRDIGLIKSKYTGKEQKLILHIQDAHCNFEAQSNIVKILENLIRNYGLTFIAVEGAEGAVDTSWFKSFPDEDVRKEVATYFMKKGEITGPEFLSITSDYPIKLFGAETKQYYVENLNAFTSSYMLKEETEKYYNQIKTVLNRLKGQVYTQELKDFDAKQEEYEKKKLAFNDYVRYLQGLCEKHKINVKSYEDFFKLISTLVYEKKIDFNVVDKERNTLIDALTAALSKEAVQELVMRSLTFKVGKISAAEYYKYLRDLANSSGIDIAQKYPNLANYVIYVSVYSKIENEKLFNEIKDVETAIHEKMFQNDEQRELYRMAHNADIMLGLINIKLLNADFDYYAAHRADMAPQVFVDYIKKAGTKYGYSYDVTTPGDGVMKAIPKLEDFYAIAIKRDRAIVDNTVKAMEKNKVQLAVLVTGGFHTEGMTRLLEKDGISYMVVSPNITKDVPTPYIQVLTNQKTPFEDLLVGTVDTKEKMLAPVIISSAVKMYFSNPEALQEFAKAMGSVGDGDLESRVRSDLQGWTRSYANRWYARAVDRFSTGAMGDFLYDDTVVVDAFSRALRDRLVAIEPELKAALGGEYREARAGDEENSTRARLAQEVLTFAVPELKRLVSLNTSRADIRPTRAGQRAVLTHDAEAVVAKLDESIRATKAGIFDAVNPDIEGKKKIVEQIASAEQTPVELPPNDLVWQIILKTMGSRGELWYNQIVFDKQINVVSVDIGESPFFDIGVAGKYGPTSFYGFEHYGLEIPPEVAAKVDTNTLYVPRAILEHKQPDGKPSRALIAQVIVGGLIAQWGRQGRNLTVNQEVSRQVEYATQRSRDARKAGVSDITALYLDRAIHDKNLPFLFDLIHDYDAREDRGGAYLDAIYRAVDRLMDADGLPLDQEKLPAFRFETVAQLYAWYIYSFDTSTNQYTKEEYGIPETTAPYDRVLLVSRKLNTLIERGIVDRALVESNYFRMGYESDNLDDHQIHQIWMPETTVRVRQDTFVHGTYRPANGQPEALQIEADIKRLEAELTIAERALRPQNVPPSADQRIIVDLDHKLQILEASDLYTTAWEAVLKAWTARTEAQKAEFRRAAVEAFRVMKASQAYTDYEAALTRAVGDKNNGVQPIPIVTNVLDARKRLESRQADYFAVIHGAFNQFLTEQVVAKKRQKESRGDRTPVVLVLEGTGGAGKSTLVGSLIGGIKEAMQLQDSEIGLIPVDTIGLLPGTARYVNVAGGERLTIVGPLDMYSVPTIDNALRTLRSGGTLIAEEDDRGRVVRKGQAMGPNVEVIVVEGCTPAFYQEVRDQADLIVSFAEETDRERVPRKIKRDTLPKHDGGPRGLPRRHVINDAVYKWRYERHLIEYKDLVEAADIAWAYDSSLKGLNTIYLRIRPTLPQRAPGATIDPFSRTGKVMWDFSAMERGTRASETSGDTRPTKAGENGVTFGVGLVVGGREIVEDKKAVRESALPAVVAEMAAYLNEGVPGRATEVINALIAVADLYPGLTFDMINEAVDGLPSAESRRILSAIVEVAAVYVEHLPTHANERMMKFDAVPGLAFGVSLVAGGREVIEGKKTVQESALPTVVERMTAYLNKEPQDLGRRSDVVNALVAATEQYPGLTFNMVGDAINMLPSAADRTTLNAIVGTAVRLTAPTGTAATRPTKAGDTGMALGVGLVIGGRQIVEDKLTVQESVLPSVVARMVVSLGEGLPGVQRRGVFRALVAAKELYPDLEFAMVSEAITTLSSEEHRKTLGAIVEIAESYVAQIPSRADAGQPAVHNPGLMFGVDLVTGGREAVEGAKTVRESMLPAVAARMAAYLKEELLPVGVGFDHWNNVFDALIAATEQYPRLTFDMVSEAVATLPPSAEVNALNEIIAAAVARRTPVGAEEPSAARPTKAGEVTAAIAASLTAGAKQIAEDGTPVANSAMPATLTRVAVYLNAAPMDAQLRTEVKAAILATAKKYPIFARGWLDQAIGLVDVDRDRAMLRFLVREAVAEAEKANAKNIVTVIPLAARGGRFAPFAYAEAKHFFAINGKSSFIYAVERSVAAAEKRGLTKLEALQSIYYYAERMLAKDVRREVTAFARANGVTLPRGYFKANIIPMDRGMLNPTTPQAIEKLPLFGLAAVYMAAMPGRGPETTIIFERPDLMLTAKDTEIDGDILDTLSTSINRAALSASLEPTVGVLGNPPLEADRAAVTSGAKMAPTGKGYIFPHSLTSVNTLVPGVQSVDRYDEKPERREDKDHQGETAKGYLAGGATYNASFFVARADTVLSSFRLLRSAPDVNEYAYLQDLQAALASGDEGRIKAATKAAYDYFVQPGHDEAFEIAVVQKIAPVAGEETRTLGLTVAPLEEVAARYWASSQGTLWCLGLATKAQGNNFTMTPQAMGRVTLENATGNHIMLPEGDTSTRVTVNGAKGLAIAYDARKKSLIVAPGKLVKDVDLVTRVLWGREQEEAFFNPGSATPVSTPVLQPFAEIGVRPENLPTAPRAVAETERQQRPGKEDNIKVLGNNGFAVTLKSVSTSVYSEEGLVGVVHLDNTIVIKVKENGVDHIYVYGRDALYEGMKHLAELSPFAAEAAARKAEVAKFVGEFNAGTITKNQLFERAMPLAKQAAESFNNCYEQWRGYSRDDIEAILMLATHPDVDVAKKFHKVWIDSGNDVWDDHTTLAMAVHDRIMLQTVAYGRTQAASPVWSALDATLNSYGITNEEQHAKMLRELAGRPAMTAEQRAKVKRVIVMSKVKVGSDIAIVSPILARIGTDFPNAKITLVGSPHGYKVFGGVPGIEFSDFKAKKDTWAAEREGFAGEGRQAIAQLTAGLQPGEYLVLEPGVSRISHFGTVPPLPFDAAKQAYYSWNEVVPEGETMTTMVNKWMNGMTGLDETAAPIVVPSNGTLPGDQGGDRVAVANELFDRLGFDRSKTIIFTIEVSGDAKKDVGYPFDREVIARLVEAGYSVIIRKGYDPYPAEAQRAEEVGKQLVGTETLTGKDPVLNADQVIEVNLDHLSTLAKPGPEVRVVLVGDTHAIPGTLADEGFLAALIGQGAMWVGYSSSPKHMAAAQGKKGVVFYMRDRAEAAPLRAAANGVIASPQDSWLPPATVVNLALETGDVTQAIPREVLETPAAIPGGKSTKDLVITGVVPERRDRLVARAVDVIKSMMEDRQPSIPVMYGLTPLETREKTDAIEARVEAAVRHSPEQFVSKESVAELIAENAAEVAADTNIGGRAISGPAVQALAAEVDRAIAPVVAPMIRRTQAGERAGSKGQDMTVEEVVTEFLAPMEDMYRRTLQQTVAPATVNDGVVIVATHTPLLYGPNSKFRSIWRDMEKQGRQELGWDERGFFAQLDKEVRDRNAVLADAGGVIFVQGDTPEELQAEIERAAAATTRPIRKITLLADGAELSAQLAHAGIGVDISQYLKNIEAIGTGRWADVPRSVGGVQTPKTVLLDLKSDQMQEKWTFAHHLVAVRGMYALALNVSYENWAAARELFEFLTGTPLDDATLARAIISIIPYIRSIEWSKIREVNAAARQALISL